VAANGSRTAGRDVPGSIALVVAACAVPLSGWLFWALVLRLGPNDFHDYWLAGKLLLEGKSPYDAAALSALAAREHLSFSLGGGYSYPLPFALVMVPFAELPFAVAVTAFNALSLAAFGVTVAAWLRDAHAAASRRRLVGAAFVAGCFPPIYGTVAMGQANLALFPLMAAGMWLAADRHQTRRTSAAAGALLGLAAVVKLVPGALLAPLALARRWTAGAALAAAALAAAAVAAMVAPWAMAGSTGLASNLDADAFYTNQSINGFVSRLVTNSSKSLAIAHGAFDPGPAMLAITAVFGAATLAVLWAGRERLLERAGLVDGLAFVLVAATIGAPKTSFWNEAFVLVAVALVLAVETPDLRLSRLDPFDRGSLALWFVTAIVWAVLWAIEPPRSGPLAIALNLGWSASLLGMLALWLMLARRLARPRSRSRAAL